MSKCKQAKVKIIISHSTKKEFFDTIDYYVSQIAQFPRGEVFAGAYEQLTDYNIFAFYESWHQSHSALSLKYFIFHIRTLYHSLVSQYGITDDEKIPKFIYDSPEFKEKRNAYSSSIKNKKLELKPFYTAEDESYSLRYSHDATVIRYVELLREKYDEDKDIFLISSDKALRYWDMTRREILYPVVVYPSQLFLILIKLCGRSANDYDSFVSFINIRATSKQITPEKANIIISGISSITEDIETQEGLVSAVYDDEFQKILQRCKTDDDLYKQTQRFSQNYLEAQLKEKGLQIVSIAEVSAEKEQQVQKLQSDVIAREKLLQQKQDDIEEKSKELDKKREQICNLAEKQILPRYFFDYYFAPIAAVLLTLVFIVFIVLQFFFGDKQWNFAMSFFIWVKDTAFGKMVGDYVYAIDAAFAVAIGFVLKKFMRNPFNRSKKEKAKADRVENYIISNHLE